jgi:hypothetical protein
MNRILCRGYVQAQVHRPRPGSYHFGDAALCLPDGHPAHGRPGARPCRPLETQVKSILGKYR